MPVAEVLRSFIPVFILTLLSGCNPEEENTTTLYFQDSLYKVDFIKTGQLDTFYSWKHLDDNQCSDYRKYRYANKLYQPHIDTGMWNVNTPDSCYQFTFIHVNNYNCRAREFHYKADASEHLNRDWILAKQNGYWIDTLWSKDTVLVKTIMKMWAYKIRENAVSLPAYHLKSLSVMDSIVFVADAECKGSDCGNFISEMVTVVNSMKLDIVYTD